nr:O-methyltransferase [Marchantia paleacea]
MADVAFAPVATMRSDQDTTLPGETLHQGSGHKSLLKSDELYQYLLKTSVYPREPASMKKLRESTASHPWNHMATAPDEGQFLQFLLKTMNAKNTLELGVYTGYSLLATALALPDDGKIIAVDISRESYNLGLPMIEEAGVANKIEFRESACIDVLQELVSQEAYHGFFDFVFVDADKKNYINYHQHLVKLVKIGGIIAYDNTLWAGAVIASDDEPLPDYIHYHKGFVKELNISLAADSRFEICQLTVSDGVTLCRRIV